MKENSSIHMNGTTASNNNNQSAPASTVNVQRRVIEINHALSGIYGRDVQHKANRISQIRKEVLRRLERKKKHSAVLHEQLYEHLEKFPEQKHDLQKQVSRAKKQGAFDLDEKLLYPAPTLYYCSSEPSTLSQLVSELRSFSSILNLDQLISP